MNLQFTVLFEMCLHLKCISSFHGIARLLFSIFSFCSVSSALPLTDYSATLIVICDADSVVLCRYELPVELYYRAITTYYSTAAPLRDKVRLWAMLIACW